MRARIRSYGMRPNSHRRKHSMSPIRNRFAAYPMTRKAKPSRVVKHSRTRAHDPPRPPHILKTQSSVLEIPARRWFIPIMNWSQRKPQALFGRGNDEIPNLARGAAARLPRQWANNDVDIVCSEKHVISHCDEGVARIRKASGGFVLSYRVSCFG
jgi:hypothetical protein